MVVYLPEDIGLADKSPCAAIRADLKLCLLNSDCCKKVSGYFIYYCENVYFIVIWSKYLKATMVISYHLHQSIYSKDNIKYINFPVQKDTKGVFKKWSNTQWMYTVKTNFFWMQEVTGKL